MAYKHEPHESVAYQIIGGAIFGLLGGHALPSVAAV